MTCVVLSIYRDIISAVPIAFKGNFSAGQRTRLGLRIGISPVIIPRALQIRRAFVEITGPYGILRDVCAYRICSGDDTVIDRILKRHIDSEIHSAVILV